MPASSASKLIDIHELVADSCGRPNGAWLRDGLDTPVILRKEADEENLLHTLNDRTLAAANGWSGRRKSQGVFYNPRRGTVERSLTRAKEDWSQDQFAM
jgi:hypothetical protein